GLAWWPASRPPRGDGRLGPPGNSVRSASLHFPTQQGVLALSPYQVIKAALRGLRRESVCWYGSACGGLSAHGLLRSSSLAHLGRWVGWEWRRSGRNCRDALKMFGGKR